ncbi:FtsW/RodA/SpoVE family cell cycle protein [Candidatus Absconditicoccus praedator]|uniref:FtsW/RodA/SpoVE family cell cycle protein n=1 Tax=Candidatus Absconditicoccus praedator TaxID=2735562 RepID=UPI001E3F1C80|nr:FtsW/RodA/SpoVE family cell cycle protein [Candidatus Absconditicoccus praedator]UFX82640.1 FtsW/RodA/SpoVE family cell cycle protein [Candidatus Absconditicoccus praedator]
MQIIVVGILLTIFGVLAMYSVSIYESFRLTVGLENLEPSNYFYFLRQMQSLIIGLIVAIIAYKIPLRFIQEYRNIIFIFVVLFQLLVFTPIGIELQGSKGWLYIQGLGTVQPAELFKLGFVIFLSGWFVRKKKELSSIPGFIAFLIVAGVFSVIFLAIPDLGTLMVIGPVALIMYWYAGGKIKYVLGLLFVGLFLGYTIGMQFDYIRVRFEYFFDPSVDEDARGIGWQTQQALTAIGGGGFLGAGYGKGLQKFGYIPEAQSDFVFAAFSEEVGFLGNSILLTLYFLLSYFFLKNLRYVKNEYFRVLGVGIISLIMIQAFVNIGVNVNILPLTGITLPFVSYGGTALMINFVQIVLLYKIITEKT